MSYISEAQKAQHLAYCEQALKTLQQQEKVELLKLLDTAFGLDNLKLTTLKDAYHLQQLKN